ncbi:MAG: hypothetical protein KGI60_00855 [Patescibacteria group bacterium]|nr:hypothetical protein [Patescibacteria group bacterium]
MDNYNFGRSKEVLVANDLVRCGFRNVQLTKGSRGPFDVFGNYEDGHFILVQVKSSRITFAAASASGDDKDKLIAIARQHSAEAYIAYVVGDQIQYEKVV